MKRTSYVGVVFTVLLVAPSTLLSGAEKGQKSSDKEQAQGTVHTVEASVGYPTNAGVGIQAERQPGQFTIPKGSKGAKLKYRFADPKSDYTSTKLRGGNIYSVTEKRYMHELDHNPDFSLPPGEYKFVVGGQPGAMGTLTYTTVPSTDTVVDTKKPPTNPPKKEKHPTSDDLEKRAKELVGKGWKPPELNPGEGKAVIPLNCTIELTMWHPADPGKNRSSVTLEIRDSKVTGQVERVFPGSNENNAQISEQRITDEYGGTLQDSRIRGTMKTKSWPKTLKIFDRNTGKLSTDYVYTASAESPFSFEFHADGTMRWECTRTSMTSHTHFNVGTDGEGKTDITHTSGPENIPPEYRAPGYGVWRLRK